MNEENKVQQEISIIEILYELKKKKYVLLIFILIAILGVFGYKFLVPQEYTYESNFTFLVDKSINNRSSLLGNSSVLNNDNLYLDINISDNNNTINAFKNISPNSYEDILNADSSLLYFSKLNTPYNGRSLLDSLQEKNKINTAHSTIHSDISLIKKYLNYKVFKTKYNNEKNIISISVTTKNQTISELWVQASVEYITKYIQHIQNQKIQEQFASIEKAIKENKHFNGQETENKKLYETINKILTKQLYEYRLKSALLDNSPFNIISTKSIPDKLSTPMLFIIAIIIGTIAGGIWIFAEKIWKESIKNLTKR